MAKVLELQLKHLSFISRKFLKIWEYQTTLPASWEICMQVKKQQLVQDMDWFQIGKGVCHGCKLSPWLFNLYAEYIWSHHFMANRWEKMDTVAYFIFLDSKVTMDWDYSREIKTLAPWKETYDKPPQHIEKQRHYFAYKGLHSQSYYLSSSHIQMWELDIKKAEHQRLNVLELWCQIRLLRIPWTARKSNLSIPKKINPEYSLEGPMLKLKP